MKRSSFAIALLAGVSLPVIAFAADRQPSNDDLRRQIEALSNQIELLKAQIPVESKKAATEAINTSLATKASADDVDDLKDTVKKVENKSLSKWLSIGGDYRFRFDSLAGTSVAFSDAAATMNNAYNNAVIAGGATLSNFATMNRAMMAANDVASARAFLATYGAGLQSMTPAKVAAYSPDNSSLFTNRFGLDLHAKATEDVTVNARLVMYKAFGDQSSDSVTNAGAAPFFADRTGSFDGTIGHVPSTSLLDVDRVYATWSNIADEPIWFSVGRRPSTNGAPSNLRMNNPRPGNGGTPALLVDYAFDGMTVGYAPDILSLPGFYTKICYGRGFDSGFTNPTNSLSDTDMLGVAVIPIDTDPLRVWTQWNRGFNIFDAPKMSNTYFGSTQPRTNLGDIDWFGAGAMSTMKKVGPGDLNFFFDTGLSVTHPNSSVSAQNGFEGLLTGAFFNPENPTDRVGWAAVMGVRYDLPTLTKIGFEYNHGSKDWITFAPSADDIWTSKYGTRGNVYEVYMIQELGLKPISSVFSKTFFRLGFQYYQFDYTGSNSWVGAPMKVSNVNQNTFLATTPLKNAYDLYATFEVKF